MQGYHRTGYWQVQRVGNPSPDPAITADHITALASSCTTRQQQLRTAFVAFSILASRQATLRRAATLVSKISRTKHRPTSIAPVFLSTGMKLSVISCSYYMDTDNQQDLAKHFLPYHAISTKICRDTPSGVSKEVGFARYVNSGSSSYNTDKDRFESRVFTPSHGSFRQPSL